MCIIYTYKRYGDDTVCRIITFGTSAPKSAIKDVAKAIGVSREQKESYVELGDTLAAVVPGKPKEHIATYLPIFKEMAESDNRIMEIVERAMSIEGAYNHYGMHAAGVIISDNDNVNEYVPLSWDEENRQWKCQCNMVEAEEMGLLKMDFLGLKNLNIITEILRLIYKRTGIKIDPNVDINEESEVIKAVGASGKTDGIFQLESPGMKDVEKKMGIDTFADVVLLLAAYRPGPMDSIPQMIKVKKGSPAEYKTEMLRPILESTYGVMIYQEQVQQIFRALAGYSFGRADLVRRAMSKKKESVFLAEKPIFVHGCPEDGICGCVANGIPADVAESIFDDMVSFAEYAFNKSHAAVYARITYILMWLKYYYPLEFMTVALKWASKSALIKLMAECKELGIEVIQADINRAGNDFSIVDGKIMFGLTSIKGIGDATPIINARNEGGAFVSFLDFFVRGHFKKDITEKLIGAGAFDNLHNNRKALELVFSEVSDIAQGIKKYEKNIEKERDIIAALEKIDSLRENGELTEEMTFDILKAAGYKAKTIPEASASESKIADYESKIIEIKAQIQDVIVPMTISEDIEARLNTERELIGVYISGHPMDAYERPRNITDIANVQGGQIVSVCGVISDFVIRQRKTDNKDMGFFELEDKSALIEVCCFTKPFENYGELLGENRVVEIRGKVMEEEIFDESDEDAVPQVILKISVYDVKEVKKKEHKVHLRISSMFEWNDLRDTVLLPYIVQDGGSKLFLYDSLLGEFRETNLRVSPAIGENEILQRLMFAVN